MNLINSFYPTLFLATALGNMSQYHRDEMEYVADDNEMAEVEDDVYFRGRAFGESDSEDDDEYEALVCFES